jgi:hypothetical protein
MFSGTFFLDDVAWWPLLNCHHLLTDLLFPVWLIFSWVSVWLVTRFSVDAELGPVTFEFFFPDPRGHPKRSHVSSLQGFHVSILRREKKTEPLHLCRPPLFSRDGEDVRRRSGQMREEGSWVKKSDRWGPLKLKNKCYSNIVGRLVCNALYRWRGQCYREHALCTVAGALTC